ncbi:MAG: hypothetical protein KAS70_04510 [Planctomycetes bacterium]|nr:hypothetical protein [Planctomycetota bacterium]
MKDKKVNFRLLGIMLLLAGGLVCLSTNLVAQKPAAQPLPLENYYVPGSWLKYDIIKLQRTGPSFKKTLTSRIKITALEQKSRRGKQTWLELVANEGKESQKIVCFPVNNQGQPIIEKLWVKPDVMPTAEIPLSIWSRKTNLTPEQVFKNFTETLMILPVSQTHDNEIFIESEKITLFRNNRKTYIDCDKYRVKNTGTNRIEKRWYARLGGPEIPLSGLVKLMIIEGDRHTLIILNSYGDKNGKSLITEKPMVLDFRE